MPLCIAVERHQKPQTHPVLDLLPDFSPGAHERCAARCLLVFDGGSGNGGVEVQTCLGDRGNESVDLLVGNLLGRIYGRGCGEEIIRGEG